MRKAFLQQKAKEDVREIALYVADDNADTAPEEKRKIAHDLKVYCGLDTYAMYAIWHHLQEAISEVAVPVRSMYAPIHSAAAFATISLASEKEVE